MTNNVRIRPVPIINNLGLFARLIADLSIARDGEELFRWVAGNGGAAADYDNLLVALRAFGAYKNAGEAILVNEQVLDRSNPMWLQSSTERLYKGALDGMAIHAFPNYYSNPDVLKDVQNVAVKSWGYTSDEAVRVAGALKAANVEIWKRRERKNRSDKRHKVLVRVACIAIIFVAVTALGMCTRSGNSDCDYSTRGAICQRG